MQTLSVSSIVHAEDLSFSLSLSLSLSLQLFIQNLEPSTGHRAPGTDTGHQTNLGKYKPCQLFIRKIEGHVNLRMDAPRTIGFYVDLRMEAPRAIGFYVNLRMEAPKTIGFYVNLRMGGPRATTTPENRRILDASARR